MPSVTFTNCMVSQLVLQYVCNISYILIAPGDDHHREKSSATLDGSQTVPITRQLLWLWEPIQRLFHCCLHSLHAFHCSHKLIDLSLQIPFPWTRLCAFAFEWNNQLARTVGYTRGWCCCGSLGHNRTSASRTWCHIQRLRDSIRACRSHSLAHYTNHQATKYQGCHDNKRQSQDPWVGMRLLQFVLNLSPRV